MNNGITTRREDDDQIAGGLMVAAAGISILAMAHHPVGNSAPGLARLVHGAMMVLMLILLAGFTRFASRRGLARLPVLLGLIAYGASTLGNLMAATVSGFLAPALVEREASPELLALMWPLNQAFAFEAAYASAAAFALWGVDLAVRGPRAIERLLGAAGLATGLVPSALLATGVLDLHVAGAAIVYAAQAAFAALAGFWLIGKRV